MSRTSKRLLAGWDERRINRRDMDFLSRAFGEPMKCAHCALHRQAVAHAQYRRKARGWR